VGNAPSYPIDSEALAQGAALSAAPASLASAGQAAAEAQLALSQLNGGALNADPAQIRATDPAALEEAVKNYADELVELTEVLSRVKAQTARMGTDSEEMENLNRTLTGIATVYELQLRNISKQVSTIEHIDEQTRKMASQIEELNGVYARMIQALTVNMGMAPGQVPATKAE
ncbi:MAG: gliding motility protein GldL, partial [Bacteroidaceae bacterium]|nr:gliding motility protein GldL [Bacteroidaceae bacterium]